MQHRLLECMFKALEIGSVIDLDPATLVAVERSSNTQNLSIGAGPRRPTRAYIAAFAEPAGTYRLVVFLGRLERTHEGLPQGLLFRSEPPSVSASSYAGILGQALTMVQSQGFTMERVDFAIADVETRTALVAELPFHPDRLAVAPPAPARPSSSEQALGSSRFGARSEVTQQAISVTEVERLGRLLTLF